jgi:hypothetical protein
MPYEVSIGRKGSGTGHQQYGLDAKDEGQGGLFCAFCRDESDSNNFRI